MSDNLHSALVLGAGIQGSCIALMLARRGVEVHLIDKCPDIMTQASLNYEGRIHLGLLYARDTTMGTGDKLLQDALHFAPYLEYLLGKSVDWASHSSSANYYLVPDDSALSLEDLRQYYGALQQIYNRVRKNERLHYLGIRPEALCSQASIPSCFNQQHLQAGFLTEERSVDHIAIKRIIKEQVLAASNIHLHLNHTVHQIRNNNEQGYVVSCTEEAKYDIYGKTVINCLWENRIRFDHTVGMTSEHGESIRLKFGLLGKKDSYLETIPSFILTHGAYGSLVNIPTINRVFLSWYNASLLGMIPYGKIPEVWQQVCNGNLQGFDLHDIQTNNLAGFKTYLPDLENIEILGAKAGLILAEGSSDIPDPKSKLHKRSLNPIKSKKNYYSVNTSKYTSAPRNTLLLEELLFGQSDFHRL